MSGTLVGSSACIHVSKVLQEVDDVVLPKMHLEDARGAQRLVYSIDTPLSLLESVLSVLPTGRRGAQRLVCSTDTPTVPILVGRITTVRSPRRFGSREQGQEEEESLLVRR